jgi:hypothetical protein
MFGIILAVAILVGLYAGLRAVREPGPVVQLMMASYVFRILLTQVLREIPFFSYGAGGDCSAYESLAWFIARFWDSQGLQYITSEQIPEIGPTSLPPNLFALIIYLNGGELTRTGCVSVIALAATLCCYNLYKLAVEMGANPDISLKVAGLMLFSPGYFFYTADMFKDGLVAFLIIAALGAAFRLARRFSVQQLVIAGLSVVALWYVRFYLIFLALAPLATGILGTGKRSFLRPVFVILGATVLMGIVGNVSGAVNELSTRANATFDLASSKDVRDWNRIGGSGVAFDDGGSPLGALHLKIAYTLFSPFPWQGGSAAMQIGKLDALAWYYLFFRATKASRRLFNEDRTLLMMFLIFILPTTVAYATTMSNIGLVLRQRIPIVLMGSLLACLSWPGRRDGGTFTNAK